MPFLTDLIRTSLETARDVVPIVVILGFFQIFVLRRNLPHPSRTLQGFALVLAGLVLFLMGLEQAIFPVGKTMAAQFTTPEFLGVDGDHDAAGSDPWAYFWIYAFAFAIGFSTTVAEPALIAVANKAEDLSGGAIGSWGLRIAVATGVAIGISVGAFRIVIGAPLHYFIGAGYVVVIVQTLFAPKLIVPLAYDSGGVTTSTVTVPLVAALGLGLAESIPGRSPLIDGFGLIAFASLFPIITVMAYAQISEWMMVRARLRSSFEATDQTELQEDGP
jgi:hypothetical protein